MTMSSTILPLTFIFGTIRPNLNPRPMPHHLLFLLFLKLLNRCRNRRILLIITHIYGLKIPLILRSILHLQLIGKRELTFNSFLMEINMILLILLPFKFIKIKREKVRLILLCLHTLLFRLLLQQLIIPVHHICRF